MLSEASNNDDVVTVPLRHPWRWVSATLIVVVLGMFIYSLYASPNINHDIIMSGMNDTLERQEVLNFVDYFSAGFEVVVAKGNREGIKSFADLCGKTVAIQTATAQIDLINAVNPSCAKKIEVLEFPTDGDAQNAIRAGKAVAGVNDGQVAAYTAHTAGDGEYFEIVAPSDAPDGDTSASSRYFETDLTEPFVLVDGHISVPTAPGIGVDPIPEIIDRFAVSREWIKA